MRKVFLLMLAVLMSFVISGGGSAFGATTSPTSLKESLNPNNQRTLRAATMSIMSTSGIQNDFVAAKIGPDGRYNFGLRNSTVSNWYNISYSWPSDPWSSFVSTRVDGQDFIFGSNSGTFVQSPHNVDGLTNEAIWRMGDVAIRQVIQIGENPATGAPDAVQLRYVLTNAGTVPHDVGLRIMIDTMLQGNDGAPFRVPGSGGMESVTREREYSGPAVPDFWQAFRDLSNPEIASQYTLRGGGATPPDRLTINDWGIINNTTWDCTVNPGRSVTGDSAVGMWWNPAQLAPGETRTIVTYYGKPRVGGTANLTLSCPSQLSYADWSSSPFNVVAYLNNNTGEAFSDVTMRVETSLNLVDNDPIHPVGNLSPGSSAQTIWRLKPSAPGVYTVRVSAFKQVAGSPQLIASAESQVNALPPPVPDNIQLTGISGTSSDGTPVAGRTSPLTVRATFTDPQPVSVVMTATDSAGRIYSANMTLNSGAWIHTFVPAQVGLWGSPLQITITPVYASGPGAPLQFNVILTDPSGFIFNSARGEDWRLPDATVALQYFDPALGSWVSMSQAAYPGRMSPVNNPQLTDREGRYGWDVADGRYRVQVSRPGFASATSREVTIPPAVTDLNVGLTPTDSTPPGINYSGVTSGGVYPGPVTVNLEATDTDSGVRYLAYTVDGGAEVRVDLLSASVLVSSGGSHTVNYRAVDHAGNETSGQVVFTIGSSGAPVLTWLPPLSTTDPASVSATGTLPIRFTWTRDGSPILDKSVSIRVRNNRTGTIITGYTFGYNITYDTATGGYLQEFSPARFRVPVGTQLKIMVYFGGKLAGTALVNVN